MQAHQLHCLGSHFRDSSSPKNKGMRSKRPVGSHLVKSGEEAPQPKFRKKASHVSSPHETMTFISGSDLVGTIQGWTPPSIDVAAKLLGLPVTSGAFLPYLPPPVFGKGCEKHEKKLLQGTKGSVPDRSRARSDDACTQDQMYSSSRVFRGEETCLKISAGSSWKF
ncbi:unnamed protein product [Leuciscus chuanchicus]